jgi:hypothetical protein
MPELVEQYRDEGDPDPDRKIARRPAETEQTDDDEECDLNFDRDAEASDAAQGAPRIHPAMVWR